MPTASTYVGSALVVATGSITGLVTWKNRSVLSSGDTACLDVGSVQANSLADIPLGSWAAVLSFFACVEIFAAACMLSWCCRRVRNDSTDMVEEATGRAEGTSGNKSVTLERNELGEPLAAEASEFEQFVAESQSLNDKEHADRFLSGKGTIPASKRERALMARILGLIDDRANELQAKGLTQRNFSFGVTSTIFVTWAFAAIPQHFWIVYLVFSFVLFTLRWINMTRPDLEMGQHFYWFDFCWIANFLGSFTLLYLCFAPMTDFLPVPDRDGELRKFLWGSFFGVACGPLLLAVGGLQNALIFHDVDNTASVLIHLMPGLVMYTILWHNDKLHEDWPNMFTVDGRNDMDPFNDIFANAVKLYVAWFFLFVIWQLTHGMTLPEKGYDTIFHANMRGHIGVKIAGVVGVSKEDYETMKAENSFTRTFVLVYMAGHAIAVCLSFLFALLCFHWQVFHWCYIALHTLSAIYCGGGRYTYYVINNYSALVKKELGIPKARTKKHLNNYVNNAPDNMVK